MDRRHTPLEELLLSHKINTSQYVLMAEMLRITPLMTARRQWFFVRNDPLRHEHQYTAYLQLEEGEVEERHRCDVDSYEDALRWIIETYVQWEEKEALLRQNTVPIVGP